MGLVDEFYLNTLGLTLDANGCDVNIGQQQFHLGSLGDKPQVVHGCFGLAIPALSSLRKRLQTCTDGGRLSDTKFAWLDHGDYLNVTCPWGNKFLIWDCEVDVKASPSKLPKLGAMHAAYDDDMSVRKGPNGTGGAGIRFIEFICNDAKKVGKFYETYFQ